MIIDTHCHLTDERYQDICSMIADFGENNLSAVITVGYDMESSLKGLDIARAHDTVFSALGIHPHDSTKASQADYDLFLKLSSDKKVVAIGETGLDYFYDLSDRETQKRVFVEHLELAHTAKLPVALHIRDAYEDARKILSDNRHLLSYGAVLHCYSGSSEYVKIFDKFDCFYSFGGAITFKNAKHNLESLKTVPLDRLLFETDCPYMTPVPFRGKTNEPKMINLVLEKASEVLEIEQQELETISTINAKNLFKKLV